MKKYLKELIILLVQLLLFYIFPLFAGPTDAMGMVLLLIILAFILSLILGAISDNKLKFLYPIIVAIIFLPSVFIYYNDSALIHSLWYLVVSAVGMGVGALIHLVYKNASK